MDDRDARVREEAYRLWVAAGRPEGDERKHWFEAEQSISASDRAGEKAVAKIKEPGAAAVPTKLAAQAAGAVAADLGSIEAKGRSAKEAEAFAKSRPTRSPKDVEGAAAAPAAGPAGAAPKLMKEAGETSAEPAVGNSEPGKSKPGKSISAKAKPARAKR